MNIIFSKAAWDEYLYCQQTDKKTLKKINNLIEAITRSPYEGAGNPEQLKYEYSGYWSRRIDLKNRFVFVVKNDCCEILQCKEHY